MIGEGEAFLKIVKEMHVNSRIMREYVLVTKAKMYRFNAYFEMDAHDWVDPDSISIKGVGEHDGIQIGDHRWSVRDLVAAFASDKSIRIDSHLMDGVMKQQHVFPTAVRKLLR